MTFDPATLRDRPLVADGPVSATIDQPDQLTAAYQSYFAAGAQILCTATLNANRIALGKSNAAGRLAEINERAVAIARAAAGTRAHVAGQIGSTGCILALEEISEDHLAEVVGEQAQVLSRAGADVLLLARFSDAREASIAIRAARAASKLPIIAALMLDPAAEPLATPAGEVLGAAVAALVTAGADVIGLDCLPVELALTAVQAAAAQSDRPLFVRLDAAGREFDGENVVYGETPAGFATRAVELHRAGAKFIAGCCGTTPAHLRAAADRLIK